MSKSILDQYKFKLSEETSVLTTYTLDIPLFLRLLEYAKETAMNDIVLHKLVENMEVVGATHSPLTIDDYDEIVKGLDQYNDMTETKGLDMQIAGRVGDTLKVVIAGTQYFYKPTNGMSIEQFANKVRAMMQFSYGKTLAWIKSNSVVEKKI